MNRFKPTAIVTKVAMSLAALALMIAPREASAQCDCAGPNTTVTDGAT
jgi:hypothetical protein